MLGKLYRLARPALFSLEPEAAHDLMLATLSRAGRAAALLSVPPPVTRRYRVMGLEFANPVGLAAGLDKNGSAIDGLAALGFGFLEVGTVTPLAQPGNPRPRMFRLQPAHALINRMGFNNQGVASFITNVGRRRTPCILGLNIGKNAATPNDEATSDYLTGLRAVYPHADYVTVNVSSPNTQGLRELQHADALDLLLAALKEEQLLLQQQHLRYVPIALKIAPDLTDQQVKEIAGRLMSHGIDGVIATNTTLARDQVEGLADANQAGGLSGGPLQKQSNHVLELLAAELSGRVPIIGVGGILCGEDAARKIKLGAALVQIYTGLIYRGPQLIAESIAAIEALERL